MVARRLAAQPDLGARRVRLADDAADHPLHRVILLVEQLCKLRGIARSTPRASWVRSLLPIENPSKRSAKAFARITFEGILAHNVHLKPIFTAL